MNATHTLSASHAASWAPVGPANLSRLRSGLATLRNFIPALEERMRFRWQLKEMLAANPHLIDDVGLTTRQAEEEIAKPFWRR